MAILWPGPLESKENVKAILSLPKPTTSAKRITMHLVEDSDVASSYSVLTACYFASGGRRYSIPWPKLRCHRTRSIGNDVNFFQIQNSVAQWCSCLQRGGNVDSLFIFKIFSSFSTNEVTLTLRVVCEVLTDRKTSYQIHHCCIQRMLKIKQLQVSFSKS